MVITTDFESVDLSSSLGGTLFCPFRPSFVSFFVIYHIPVLTVVVESILDGNHDKNHAQKQSDLKARQIGLSGVGRLFHWQENIYLSKDFFSQILLSLIRYKPMTSRPIPSIAAWRSTAIPQDLLVPGIKGLKLKSKAGSHAF